LSTASRLTWVVLLAHPGEGVEQVADRLRQLAALIGREAFRKVEAGEPAPADHVEHQHAMVGDHRPPGFADDCRVLDAGLVADFPDVENDVVGIFLEPVVDAGAEVGLGPVVVDPEAAPDVDVLEPRA
jgi:hypothetical protein